MIALLSNASSENERKVETNAFNDFRNKKFKKLKKANPSLRYPPKFNAEWDKKEGRFWYWEKEEFETAKKIVQLLNKQIKATLDVPDYSEVNDIDQLKQFVSTLQATEELITRTKAGEATKIISDFIEQLANEVSDEKVLNLLADYAISMQKFNANYGMHKYSDQNKLLIWLQIGNNSKVKRFGSAPWWLEQGYVVKDDAKPITIIAPMTEKTRAQEAKIIATHIPYLLNGWKKAAGHDSDKMSGSDYLKMWTWGYKGHGIPKQFAKLFSAGKIYVDQDVEPLEGVEQVEAPELAWYSKDDSYNERADIMIEALKRYAKDSGIDVKHVDNLGGARGVSKGGHIELLTSNKSVALLSTFVHEMAHEMLHQATSTDKFGKDYYIGSNYSREDEELHAEAVAYTVMRKYGFGDIVKHSVIYLANWRADKEKIEKYAHLISMVASTIIDQIETRAPEIAKEKDNGDGTKSEWQL